MGDNFAQLPGISLQTTVRVGPVFTIPESVNSCEEIHKTVVEWLPHGQHRRAVQPTASERRASSSQYLESRDWRIIVGHGRRPGETRRGGQSTTEPSNRRVEDLDALTASRNGDVRRIPRAHRGGSRVDIWGNLGTTVKIKRDRHALGSASRSHRHVWLFGVGQAVWRRLSRGIGLLACPSLGLTVYHATPSGTCPGMPSSRGFAGLRRDAFCEGLIPCHRPVWRFCGRGNSVCHCDGILVRSSSGLPRWYAEHSLAAIR